MSTKGFCGADITFVAEGGLVGPSNLVKIDALEFMNFRIFSGLENVPKLENE